MSALATDFPTPTCLPFDAFAYARRASARVDVTGVDGRPVVLGGEEVMKVGITRANFDRIAHKVDRLGDFKPDFIIEDSPLVAVDPRRPLPAGLPDDALVTVSDGLDLPVVTAFRLLASRLSESGLVSPLLLKDTLHPVAGGGSLAGEVPSFTDTLLSSSAALGSLICDGLGDAILVQGEEAPGQSLRLAFNILQAAGARIFKTDYVACPSCGRTLFNLQETTARIKAATVHLKGVKIAIMGCIVNGPGEMADADFGYVGGAPGKINLYVGKQAVKFNIPEAEAVSRLVDLIKEHGRWVEPAPTR
ncbi:MAG: flavodoxin-dependent (E)-4-hydroxy-3-methylbut-2-enyl-diphosphate synthase [Verrucomicrobiales bacterium]